MLTFVTIYLLRLYYPKIRAQQRYFTDRSRRNNYGSWAVKQEWQSEKPYVIGFN
ncbi:hypothetical protein [Chitinophaga skermanii]|uniref:hypothetical protein n=1 Tax=Chitinophaga skermanii TaxID=331697 RepID=UPI0013143418|nr:hypothetical protein [Chitinophaga skermanii]